MPSDALASYRRLFPVTRRYAYLNHAGVGPTSTAVLEAVHANLTDLAEHGVARGMVWEERVERVRGAAGQLIGARPHEIAFVRNTSHGLALVAGGLDWRPGDNLLCAVSEEYPSNVYPWQRLEPRGVTVRPVSAQGGRLEVDSFARAGDDRTRLVTVSSVQYASGFRVDLPALGQLCRDRGWLLCVDGIQSVGCIPIDVHAAGVHFLAADSHKWMLGLPGIGMLFVHQELAGRLEPALIGWKSTTDAWNFDRLHLELRSDAARLEEGTPAYSLIDGFGAALFLLIEVGVERIWQRVRALGDHLVAGLLEAGCEVASSLEDPHRSGSITFRPREGDPAALTAKMQDQGVIVSCRRGLVRISPHFYNLEAEVDQVIASCES